MALNAPPPPGSASGIDQDRLSTAREGLAYIVDWTVT